MKPLLFAAALVLVLAPAAQAQAPTGMTLSAGPAGPTAVVDNYPVLPYAGNFSVPVTVTVGCGSILAHSDKAIVTVSVDPLPAWLVAAPMDFDFTPNAGVLQSCGAGNGYAALTQNVAMTLKKEAPGIVAQPLNVKAVWAASATNPADTVASKNVTVRIQVAFHPSYTITPDATFPVTVDCGDAKFDVTIANSANAPSMVMIEEKQESTGSLSGIGPEVYDPMAHNGTDSKVFHVEYKAPADFTTATVSFKAYSHFLINPGYGAGAFQAQQNVTWTFTKGTDSGCSSSSSTTTTIPSPLPMLPAYIAVLGLSAVVASRRKA